MNPKRPDEEKRKEERTPTRMPDENPDREGQRDIDRHRKGGRNIEEEVEE